MEPRLYPEFHSPSPEYTALSCLNSCLGSVRCWFAWLRECKQWWGALQTWMVDHSVVILIATCQSWSLIRDEREETVLFPFVSCRIIRANRLHDANLPGGAREDVLKQGRVRGEGHELLELILERRLHPNNPKAPDTRVVPSLGGILNL